MHTTAATTAATTIHTPRPAIITASPDGTAPQHHFGSAHILLADQASIEVMRRADRDTANVLLSVRDNHYAVVRLTPAQLRELAARLIDAAHDIDTSATQPIDWKA